MKLTVIILVSITFVFSIVAKDLDRDTHHPRNRQGNNTEHIKTNDSDSNKESLLPTNKPAKDVVPVVQPTAVMTGEQINWQVISAGATSSSSASFSLIGTIGQTATGLASSSSYQVNSGFLQTFTGTGGRCCIGNTGDTNGDGSDDVSDLLFLVDYQFVPGAPAPPCPEEADVDGSGAIDVSDLLYLVDYQFVPGSPAPVPCP